MRLVLLLLVAVAAMTGCHRPRRYFWVPPTVEAHECLGACLDVQMRCAGGYPIPQASPLYSRRTCQEYADNCIAACPGAREVPEPPDESIRPGPG